MKLKYSNLEYKELRIHNMETSFKTVISYIVDYAYNLTIWNNLVSRPSILVDDNVYRHITNDVERSVYNTFVKFKSKL